MSGHSKPINPSFLSCETKPGPYYLIQVSQVFNSLTVSLEGELKRSKKGVKGTFAAFVGSFGTIAIVPFTPLLLPFSAFLCSQLKLAKVELFNLSKQQ